MPLLEEKFEDAKGVIISETTQWPKEKEQNNDLQIITQKTKD